MNRTNFIRVALALLINLLSTFTVRAEVGDQFIVDGLKYTITSESPDYTVELTGYDGDKPTGDLTIPETVSNGEHDFTVTSIGEQVFWGCSDLLSITVPACLKTIGFQAFYDCSGLVSFDIPDVVTIIGEQSFQGCSSLQSIVVPNSVTEIKSNAFIGCSSLKSAIIGSSVNTIGSSVFENCVELETVNIPDGVTVINKRTFKNCSSLKQIEIPENVKEIGESAFEGCSSLTSLVIPASVKTLKNKVFQSCSGISSAIIGSGVTAIGRNVFRGCQNLTDIYFYADRSKLTWNESTYHYSTLYSTYYHVFDASEWNDLERYGFMTVEDLKVNLNTDLEANYVRLEDTKGKPCVFKREFQGDISSTICLPFSITPSEGIGTFYEFTGVNDNRTEATMTQAQTPLVANTPYLFRPAADGELTFEGTIDVSEVVAGKVSDDSGNWTFTGTYAERRWDAENNTDELGRIYGFASGQGYGNTEASTEAGVFIRLNSGGIKPFRAYLEYNGTQARARSRGAAEELPDRMSVRLIGNDGQTTGISTLDIQVSDEWYDLSGRKLMNKPTKDGVYIKNGRKIVIRK